MALSKVLIANHAAVASEHPLASLAGYDVLRKGGNAFDAAVATSYALAVTMHHLGGLGGDFFCMLYEAKSGKVHSLNASGWAPTGLTLDLLRSKDVTTMPIDGPLSCVVPGQVAGISSMHEKFGSRQFGELVGSAKSLAKDGFPASEGFCRSAEAAFASLSGPAREVFAPGGRPPSPGDLIVQERLGRVIDEISKVGSKAFYEGKVAHSMVETLGSLGVPADESDFSEFKPEWVDPLVLDYRGTKVYEAPPNSMGATSLLMLSLLMRSGVTMAGPLSITRVAATMDAAATAYSRRDRMLGDPRFCEIDMDEFMAPVREPSKRTGQVREGDTTAFSVADPEGNLVSAIQSLFRHFGSRVFVPDCGIMLNCRGSGFSTSGPNVLQPRKRPLHTLSSLILENGESRVAIGASGGEHRPLQHTQFVTDLVDYGLTLEGTVDHPRFLWSEGSGVTIETGFEQLPLSEFDLHWVPLPSRTGVCQAVEVSGETRKAVCDVRGDGIPAGF